MSHPVHKYATRLSDLDLDLDIFQNQNKVHTTKQIDFEPNKPEVMGGADLPPSYMAIGGYFQYSFLTGVLSWM